MIDLAFNDLAAEVAPNTDQSDEANQDSKSDETNEDSAEVQEVDTKRLPDLPGLLNVEIPETVTGQHLAGNVVEFDEVDVVFPGTREREEEDFFFFNSNELLARVEYVKARGEMKLRFNRKMNFPDDIVNRLNYWCLPKEIRD